MPHDCAVQRPREVDAASKTQDAQPALLSISSSSWLVRRWSATGGRRRATTRWNRFRPKDNAGGVAARCFEKRAHQLLGATHPLACQRGTGCIEKRHTRFRRCGFVQQALAGAWRAVEQRALHGIALVCENSSGNLMGIMTDSLRPGWRPRT